MLDDPYVVNRSTTIDRRALLEEPEVVDAASETCSTRCARQLEAAAAG